MDVRYYCETSTGFTLFQLVYSLEAVLLIECEIPYLKLAIDLLPGTSTKEERFFHLARLDETRCKVELASEVHKKRSQSSI